MLPVQQKAYLPALCTVGKSLDQIMELKQRAGNSDLFDVMKKEKRRKYKLKSGKKKATKNCDTFSYLNKSLGYGHKSKRRE